MGKSWQKTSGFHMKKTSANPCKYVFYANFREKKGCLLERGYEFWVKVTIWVDETETLIVALPVLLSVNSNWYHVFAGIFIV